MGGTSAVLIGAPQPLQNRAAGEFSNPHLAQRRLLIGGRPRLELFLVGREALGLDHVVLEDLHRLRHVAELVRSRRVWHVDSSVAAGQTRHYRMERGDGTDDAACHDHVGDGSNARQAFDERRWE